MLWIKTYNFYNIKKEQTHQIGNLQCKEKGKESNIRKGRLFHPNWGALGRNHAALQLIDPGIHGKAVNPSKDGVGKWGFFPKLPSKSPELLKFKLFSLPSDWPQSFEIPSGTHQASVWKWPNHEIKLWDYQNLESKANKIHLEICAPSLGFPRSGWHRSPEGEAGFPLNSGAIWTPDQSALQVVFVLLCTGKQTGLFSSDSVGRNLS